MESSFDLVLTFIPIALFIALRLYASRKKGAEAKEKAKVAALLSQAASSKAGPSESDFDAHSLLPDEDEDFASAPANFYGRAAQIAPVQQDSSVPRMEDLPREVGGPAAKSFGSPGEAASAPMPRDALSRLDRLGSLQRAVVMAEVLGKPKGLENL